MKIFQTSKTMWGVMALMTGVILVQGWLIVSNHFNKASKAVAVTIASDNSQANGSSAHSAGDSWFGDDLFASGDPFEEMKSMQDHMNKMMEEAFGDGVSGTLFSNKMDLQGQPEIRVLDKGDHYRVEVSVAGVDEPQIKTELKENQLSITSTLESEQKEEDPDGGKYRHSYQSGNFQQVIAFEDSVDPDTLTSRYEDKTLILEVKKLVES